MLDMLLNRRRTKQRDAPLDGEVYVVVGLGNPGRRYRSTRHNLGFMVLDRLYDRLPVGTTRSRFQAEYVETVYEGKRVVLVKPQTFMNRSGEAVGQIVRWYKAPLDHLLIIYDELDLPFGVIRLRPGGGAGGHNGVASVIQHLNSQDVPRLRVGIDRPRAGSTVPYVLSTFTEDERRLVPAVIDRAADAAISWIDVGMTSAMNEHNRRTHENTKVDAAGS